MYTGRGGTFLSISLKLKIGYDLIQPMLDAPFPSALFFDIVEEEEFICHYQDSPLSGNIENDIIGVDDHAVCFKRIGNKYYLIDFALPDYIEMTEENKEDFNFFSDKEVLMIYKYDIIEIYRRE